MGEYSNMFNEMEIDAIGEILNISLGSSATAVSDMLERRVDITTPKVNVYGFEEFAFPQLEPAVGVEITYVEGLEGSNVMILKRTDVKSILELMMHTEIPDEEFEMDELAISAVCELMNQMMGASATALADFLGEVVNISTPVSFEIADDVEFKRKYFKPDEPMVTVSFKLDIENCLHSEFVTLMDVKLAKRLVSTFGLSDMDENGDVNLIQPSSMSMDAPAPASEPEPSSSGGTMSQDDIEALMAQMSDGSAQPAPQPAPQAMPQQPMMGMQQPVMGMQQPMMGMQQPMQQPMMGMQQPMMQSAPRVVDMQYIPQESANGGLVNLNAEEKSNLDLIMQVPLQVSVEIGRTKKPVKDILEFTKGTLVVLDKLAGDQVDIYVNGQPVAKGDVVVVDDSFGVRITEILKGREMLFKGKGKG